MIRSLPLTALSLTLGFFFIFIGSLKLTPKINPVMYNDLKQEFGRFNQVFPLYSLTGWRPFARNYRLAVGLAEVICGAILVLIPGRLKDFATIVLIFMMTGGFFTHYFLNDKFERMAPTLVFTLLLICRLIIAYQVERRERQDYEKFQKMIEEDEQEGEKEKIEEEVKEADKPKEANKQKGKKSTKKNK